MMWMYKVFETNLQLDGFDSHVGILTTYQKGRAF